MSETAKADVMMWLKQYRAKSVDFAPRWPARYHNRSSHLPLNRRLATPCSLACPGTGTQAWETPFSLSSSCVPGPVLRVSEIG